MKNTEFAVLVFNSKVMVRGKLRNVSDFETIQSLLYSIDISNDDDCNAENLQNYLDGLGAEIEANIEMRIKKKRSQIR